MGLKPLVLFMHLVYTFVMCKKLSLLLAASLVWVDGPIPAWASAVGDGEGSTRGSTIGAVALPVIPGLKSALVGSVGAQGDVLSERLSVNVPVLQELANNQGLADKVSPQERRSAQLILNLIDNALTREPVLRVLEGVSPGERSATSLLTDIGHELVAQQKLSPSESLTAALSCIEELYSGVQRAGQIGEVVVDATKDAAGLDSGRGSLNHAIEGSAEPSTASPPSPPHAGDAADFGRQSILVALGFVWNLLTIACYLVIVPVRGALLNDVLGPQFMPWMYILSAVATGLSVLAYNRFVGLPRQRLIGGTLLILTATLGGWWVLLASSHAGWIVVGFSLWADVFGSMSVTLFWTYINDIFAARGDSKRFFGFITAAGPLGGILGSWLTHMFVLQIGSVHMLLLAAVLFAVTFLLFIVMERLSGPGNPKTPQKQSKDNLKSTGIIRTIYNSKFLTLLAVLVCLERMVPDLSNYMFNGIAHEAYPNKDAFADFSATFSLWQNVFSLAASLFLTQFVLRYLGMAGALMGPALANFIGFALFLFAPANLPVIIGYNGLEGLLRYTWFKSAKEAVYTATNKDVIYRIKAFVEMFLYRFARGLAGLLIILLTAKSLLGLGSLAVAFVGIPLAFAWALVAWKLSREFQSMEKK